MKDAREYTFLCKKSFKKKQYVFEYYQQLCKFYHATFLLTLKIFIKI